MNRLRPHAIDVPSRTRAGARPASDASPGTSQWVVQWAVGRAR